MRLSSKEQVEIIRLVFSQLKLLYDEEALAGVVLTDSSYDGVKRLFGEAAIPYKPAEIDIDPTMEHSFVVHGLLFLRGTRLQ